VASGGGRRGKAVAGRLTSIPKARAAFRPSLMSRRGSLGRGEQAEIHQVAVADPPGAWCSASWQIVSHQPRGTAQEVKGRSMRHTGWGRVRAVGPDWTFRILTGSRGFRPLPDGVTVVGQRAAGPPTANRSPVRIRTQRLEIRRSSVFPGSSALLQPLSPRLPASCFSPWRDSCRSSSRCRRLLDDESAENQPRTSSRVGSGGGWQPGRVPVRPRPSSTRRATLARPRAGRHRDRCHNADVLVRSIGPHALKCTGIMIASFGDLNHTTRRRLQDVWQWMHFPPSSWSCGSYRPRALAIGQVYALHGTDDCSCTLGATKASLRRRRN
jgi:hypothetical protein